MPLNIRSITFVADKRQVAPRNGIVATAAQCEEHTRQPRLLYLSYPIFQGFEGWRPIVDRIEKQHMKNATTEKPRNELHIRVEIFRIDLERFNATSDHRGYSFSCIILRSSGEIMNTITPAIIGARDRIRKKSAKPPCLPKKNDAVFEPEPRTAARYPER